MEWKDIYDYEYLYTGEVDLSGNPCGYGTAIEVDNPEYKYRGTFFNGRFHGLGMSFHLQLGGLSMFIL